MRPCSIKLPRQLPPHLENLARRHEQSRGVGGYIKGPSKRHKVGSDVPSCTSQAYLAHPHAPSFRSLLCRHTRRLAHLSARCASLRLSKGFNAFINTLDSLRDVTSHVVFSSAVRPKMQRVMQSHTRRMPPCPLYSPAISICDGKRTRGLL